MGERPLLVVLTNSQEGFLLPILTVQQNPHVFLEVVNNEAFLYDLLILPNGFKFPIDYLNVALADEVLDIEPWWLLSKDMATSLFYYSSMLLK